MEVKEPIRTPISISEADVSRLVLPEGYKIERVKTKAEQVAELQTEIDKLEQEKGIEPADDELIDFAKLSHPYYANNRYLDALKKRKTDIENGIV